MNVAKNNEKLLGRNGCYQYRNVKLVQNVNNGGWNVVNKLQSVLGNEAALPFLWKWECGCFVRTITLIKVNDEYSYEFCGFPRCIKRAREHEFRTKGPIPIRNVSGNLFVENYFDGKLFIYLWNVLSYKNWKRCGFVHLTQHTSRS